MGLIKSIIRLICGIVGYVLGQTVKVLCFFASIAYFVLAMCALYCIFNHLWNSLMIIIGFAILIFMALFVLLFVSSSLQEM